MQELTPFGEGLALTSPSGGNPIPVTDGLVVLRPERYEKPVETYIRECLNDAWELVYQSAYGVRTKSMATPAINASVGNPKIVSNTDGSIRITHLPSDFFRLQFLWIEGWERPVTETIEKNTQKYRAQFNRYTRGNSSRPIVAVEKVGEKQYELECFSIQEDAIPRIKPETRVLYIPVTIEAVSLITDTTGMNDEVAVADVNLLSPLYYMTASLVYGIYELHQQSGIMMDFAVGLLQNISVNTSAQNLQGTIKKQKQNEIQ
jgi:hypothetical protein